MPPKDKAQLTGEEIAFIRLWIDAGADTEKKLKDVEPGDTLRQLADAIIPHYQSPVGESPKYTFAFANPEQIERLTIPSRTVFQIAKNEPAVRADFFLKESFDPRHLEELTEVREQLVKLNLSNMPLADEALNTIAKFENLEDLNLNNTPLTGDGLALLARLPRLRSLSLSGTNVTGPALRKSMWRHSWAGAGTCVTSTRGT